MSDTVEGVFEEPGSSKRIFALDAVRGIAAFVVVWYHFRLAFETNAVPWYLRLLLSGRQAVVLFFVMSGYVLSLPYWRGRALSYGAYLVRRGFRIYVPYAAAVLVAVVGAWRFSNAQLPLTPWFYRTWHVPLTGGLVVRQLLMGTGGELNTAFWSLRYEVQMSIVFPLLCWWMVRLGPAGAGLFAVIAVGMGVWLRSASVAWGACFLLGAVLACGREWIGVTYRRTPLWGKVLVLGGVVAAYGAESTLGMIFGACGVLVFAVESRARGWLETAVPMYLGRISYSMYLVHGTVLQAMLVMFYGRMPGWVFAGFFLGTTVGVSYLFCVYVEEPATRLGRRLTQRRAVVHGGFVRGQVAA
jgi:peptidoglycan/LPS O-acetylase OafA/YrhL